MKIRGARITQAGETAGRGRRGEEETETGIVMVEMVEITMITRNMVVVANLSISREPLRATDRRSRCSRASSSHRSSFKDNLNDSSSSKARKSPFKSIRVTETISRKMSSKTHFLGSRIRTLNRKEDASRSW
jgi:hypothetical protein